MHVSKFVRLMLMLALALPLLAACGGSTAATNTPKEQVESFFNDFASAMSDPDIAKAEKQQEWADKLASHIKPDQRAAFKTEITQSLKDLGDAVGSIQTMAPGAHFKVEFKNLTTTEKITGNTAEVTLTGGTAAMSLDGDLSALPPEAAAGVNQEQSVTEMFGSDASKPLPMEKVDNTWYIVSIDLNN